MASLIAMAATHGMLVPMFRVLRSAARKNPPPWVQEPVETYRVLPQRVPGRTFPFPAQAPCAPVWMDEASVAAGLDQLEALANDPLWKPPEES